MRILAALSGGIDSAVTAALLKDAGHEVIGIHLQFWSEDFRPGDEEKTPENKCCSLSALETARRLCAVLDVPFYVLNFREPFFENVVAPFLASHARGDTPNPCVTCNRTIKFGLLLDKMRELGADAIASGHYARIRKNNSNCHSKERGTGDEESRVAQHLTDKILRSAQDDNVRFELRRGVDLTKDQSYFLHTLTQTKLAHILFPLGGMTKADVRRIAAARKLPHTSGKKESTGVCFFPEAEPSGFLARHLPPEKILPGPIKTLDGKTIGQHRGLPYYTIGQRRGVDLGGMGEPHYVAGFDLTTNTLLVGTDPTIFKSALVAHSPTWIAGHPPAATFHAHIAIRYQMKPIDGTVTIDKNEKLHVAFTDPIRAVTPGQAIVFYDGDTVLGGATIAQ